MNEQEGSMEIKFQSKDAAIDIYNEAKRNGLPVAYDRVQSRVIFITTGSDFDDVIRFIDSKRNDTNNVVTYSVATYIYTTKKGA